MNSKITLAAFVVFFSMAIVGAEATTWTVCTSEYGSCDFISIQGAINSTNVLNGDTLNITGSFFEGNLSITKSLHIQSNDTLESNISGNIYINASFVNLTRFNITRTFGAPRASSALDCAGLDIVNICIDAVEHINFNRLNITGTGAFTGVKTDTLIVTSANDTNITNSRMNNMTYGILTPGLPTLNRITIADNNFSGFSGEAIGFGSGKNSTIEGNYLERVNNTLTPNGMLVSVANGSGAEHILIRNNTLLNMCREAIVLGYPSLFNNNTIEFNKIENSPCGMFGPAVVLEPSTNFRNNTIRNYSYTGTGQTLLQIKDSFTNITGNKFLDAPNFIATSVSTVNAEFANISNNTFISVNRAISSYGRNLTVYNNFIYDLPKNNSYPESARSEAIDIRGGDAIISRNNISIARVGIIVSSMAATLIYDNYVNTTSIDVKTSGAPHKFNVSKQLGPNIIGGPYIAGNFWSHYNGIDVNGDGLGDTEIPYNSSGNVPAGRGDFAPLTEPNAPPVVTFISPTPNNETLRRNWAYINVTLNESGVSATLQWNGTNESLQGNGTNWFKNKTSLEADNYTFKVYANDITNLTGVSKARYVVIDTTPITTVITFVLPTPNNETINKNFTFINITLNENGSSATLQWNGVNESMQGSGTNWFKNKISLVDGNYSFKAYANDIFGNTGISQELFVVIDAPPQAVPNLYVQGYTSTRITWNWADPTNSDFNHTEVYFENVFKANATNHTYTATNLEPNTTYTLKVRPVDNSGNKAEFTINTTQTKCRGPCFPPH